MVQVGVAFDGRGFNAPALRDVPQQLDQRVELWLRIRVSSIAVVDELNRD